MQVNNLYFLPPLVGMVVETATLKYILGKFIYFQPTPSRDGSWNYFQYRQQREMVTFNPPLVGMVVETNCSRATNLT